MNKADLITRLAMLGDDDPRLAAIAAVLNGTQQAPAEERWIGLKALSVEVGKHPVWLARLHVPQICGERIAGRRAYRVSRVMEYLRSQQCRDRIAEIADERRRQNAARKAAA